MCRSTVVRVMMQAMKLKVERKIAQNYACHYQAAASLLISAQE